MDRWDQENFIPPFELRDQEEQAEAWYNNPARQESGRLAEENLRLKKMLRENGISWDRRLTLDLTDPTGSRGTWAEPAKKSRRSSRGDKSQSDQRLPSLPVEIMLYILEYSLTSSHAILDPLARLNPNALTPEERKVSKDQIAINFLATCKAYHAEGTRFLWRNNSFVFTDCLALQNFRNLGLEHRKDMKHITMRIIARYYDDDLERDHRAPYPTLNPRSQPLRLRVIPRVHDDTLARRGFRSYTWLQVVDFLDALRPPFDPDHDKTKPRPRLLPALESLRIDLVNFPSDFLTPPGGPEMHALTAHDLSLSLKELQLTGITDCHWGADISSQLGRMVRDDGLFLKSDSTFVLSNRLRKQSDADWDARAIRAWKVLAEEYMKSKKKKKVSSSLSIGGGHHGHHSHSGLVKIQAVPEEEGAPETMWQERRTLWKRVPLSRDSDERKWVEFDRTTGAPIPANEYMDPVTDSYDPDELVCHHCQMMHSPYDDDY
ncbi:hypothetical protein QBC36DRAFT_80093 [Triangularia setosa]|uniref:Uncharacterized protein n=1 Tax=Triangularia setosa TaxID=2587417 RepID=A0AAN6VYK2_9PEZI|nr:hypothetical protein QBC36DRAFT_80093 [Podospora setosa]